MKIQEAEAQFITDYAVCETRVSDQVLAIQTSWASILAGNRYPAPTSTTTATAAHNDESLEL